MKDLEKSKDFNADPIIIGIILFIAMVDSLLDSLKQVEQAIRAEIGTKGNLIIRVK